MPRAGNGPANRRAKRRYFKRAKGFWGGRHRLYRTVREAVLRAERFATSGRRRKKRDMRRLWITRLSAAVRERGLTYSRFIAGLGKAQIVVNRKVLTDLAITDPKAFDAIFDRVKAVLV